jgi:hypothetical protein
VSNLVFTKTERGRAEVTRRSGDLAPATRHVLIMINGIDSVATLMARRLPQLQTHLSKLLELGMIAPVPGHETDLPKQRAIPPAMPVPSRPAPPPQAPDPRIDAQCRIVLASLQKHFGPNAPDVAQAMLIAHTVDEFNAAIDHIESRLIGHLGRKLALRQTQTMRLPPDP